MDHQLINKNQQMQEQQNVSLQQQQHYQAEPKFLHDPEMLKEKYIYFTEKEIEAENVLEEYREEYASRLNRQDLYEKFSLIKQCENREKTIELLKNKTDESKKILDTYQAEYDKWRRLAMNVVSEERLLKKQYEVITKSEVEASEEATTTEFFMVDSLRNIRKAFLEQGGSTSFKRVKDALENYMKLREGKMETAEDIMQFKKSLERLNVATDQYLESHKGFRWTKKGDRRKETMEVLSRNIKMEYVYLESNYQKCMLQESPNYLENKDGFAEIFQQENLQQQFQAFSQLSLQETYFQMAVSDNKKEISDDYMNATQRIKDLLSVENPTEVLSQLEQKQRKEVIHQIVYIRIHKIEKLVEKHKELLKNAPQGVDAYAYACYMCSASLEGAEYFGVQNMYEAIFSEALLADIKKEMEEIQSVNTQIKRDADLVFDITQINKWRDNMPANLQKQHNLDSAKFLQKIEPNILQMRIANDANLLQANEERIKQTTLHDEEVGQYIKARDYLYSAYSAEYSSNAYVTVLKEVSRFWKQRNTLLPTKGVMLRQKNNCVRVLNAIDQYMEQQRNARISSKEQNRLNQMQVIKDILL